MKFELNQAIEILAKTPSVLRSMLFDLSPEWTNANEGQDTFTPFDILGHLIHGEKTDWMERTTIILNQQGDRKFHPFDRFAMHEESKGKTVQDLLDTFQKLREKNLEELRRMDIQTGQFELRGLHPNLGEVTLSQLLSTWVVHDLGHIGQIVRVMAKRYKADVGPWREFLPILDR